MATPVNIVNDVGMLLKLPTKVTTELVDKSCLCISSVINEAKKAGETQVMVNIGIGTLSVNLIDMQCKFVPGKSLKTAIKNALANPENPLELELEKTFAEKLLNICEEVI